jgi:uncharacterized membrane protein
MCGVAASVEPVSADADRSVFDDVPTELVDLAQMTVVLGIVGIVAVVWVVMHHWRHRSDRREQEQTRRELAAYVAEGTMPAETAERLAGPSFERAAEQIAQRLAKGELKPEKAKQAIRALKEAEDELRGA